MNIEEVFEQWSDIESESDESDSSSGSEEEDIGNEIESDEQSWREETGKSLCISIVCFTSANITKKHNHDKHHYNKLYADYSLRTSRRITSSQGPSFHCIPWSCSITVEGCQTTTLLLAVF